MINLSTPNVGTEEIINLQKCIKTGWLSSSGKFVNDFETGINNYIGSKYSIGCINGTHALQLSLKILGVEAEDEVIVPTLTFIAPINAVKYNYATPIFMDCDKYYNIDSEKTIEFIKEKTIYKNGHSYNKITKKKIKALIPVHVWGNAVWLDELFTLCKNRNIKILEDASESLGTKYLKGKFNNKFTGTIGDIGCLSFNANKIITSGGGGMIVTNNKKIYEKALYLSNQAKDDPIKYIHNEVGYNFRITNIHAAIGLAQLKKIKIFIKQKKLIFDKYNKNMKNIEGLSIAQTPKYSLNNNWMTILKINNKSKKINKEKLIKYLFSENIETRPVWYLNHLQKQFVKCQSYKIENSLELFNNSICLPSGTNLKNKDFNYVIKVLKTYNNTVIYE